ncbi:FtsX-like permease family protein [Spirosoma sp. HMF4905]|uniref:FtsX-like permease family protein n=1 Tax=Spirosoma arboris TaxID=2682092 RepID=A0A7K1SCD0_9BACT|nr:FtsX-like permease family protein [Spirosoma arboris]MVM31472.1 FtsX-like permease family protein [Spirosoma arboris]
MKSMTPPRFAHWLLTQLHPDETLEEVEGDLGELYTYWYERSGKIQATLWYLLNVVSVLPPFVRRRKPKQSPYRQDVSSLQPTMIRNYLKIAWRNLTKNKVYSVINIGGLAVGMAVAMLIGLWIYDELTFNQYHQNYSRIAQVMRHEWFDGKKETGGQSSPMPLGTELRAAFGDEFDYVVLSTKPVNYIIASGDAKFNQSGRFMQADAPELLTLRMVQGSRAGLHDLNTILLAETLAKKLFGDGNPINRIVTIDTQVNVKVIGVYEDLPISSDFRETAYIAPFRLYGSLNSWVKDARDNWGDNSFPIYVQIAPNKTFEQVSARIKGAMLPHLKAEKAASKPEVFLHPMPNWHLFSTFENGLSITSEPMKYVLFYGVIGLFVLLLACINFTNLSTARSEKRAKEVGIRKAVGSVRAQLTSQFLSESVLVSMVAFGICLGLVQLALPWFNRVADKQIVILWANPIFWLVCIAFALFTALLSGSYPAFYLSSLQPVQTLKGLYSSGSLSGWHSAVASRKVLVVFQFTISTALIIGTASVYQQIQLAKNRPVGYDRSGLLSFPENGFLGKEDVIRNELLRTGVVAEVAESAYPLTNEGSNNTGFDWRGKTPSMNDDFGTIRISGEYGKAVGWQFVAGRDFSRKLRSDSSGLIINESAMKAMGLQQPIGEQVRSEHWQKGTYTILGVVKDMVMASPFERVRPTIFSIRGGKRWMLVKIDAHVSLHAALPKLEAAFKTIVPDVPFDYKFADEEYALKFAVEERIGKLASFFTILAIFISCLGLFGLASFMAERRTKEIGIRKVLGASALTIWRLLSEEFVLLVLTAFAIATPTAYYFLSNWLQKYEYHTHISWWVFAGSGIGTLTITLLTVSYQSIKAALVNPVKSLRSE